MNSLKYNRTFHLPWSPGGTSDDKIAKDVSSLLDIPIVITEKIDGSNTSLEKEGCYARTHAGPPTHASFDGLKALHASIKYKIPTNLQLFGEWCYALHSIPYDKLPGYFLLFNVRYLDNPIDRLEDELHDTWASWEEVKMWGEDLELPTVPVLFEGIIESEKELQSITEQLASEKSVFGDVREGVVIRVAEAFDDSDFSNCVMKWVRKNHVQTSDHWRNQEIIKNGLVYSK